MKELDAVKFIEERLSDEEGQNFLHLLAVKLQKESFNMDDYFKEKLGINNGLMDLFWTAQEEVCPLVANMSCEVEVDLLENIKELMKDVKYWEDEEGWIHTNLD
jgi:hypothetical protein